MQNATVRIRRTFAYPTEPENDDDDAADASPANSVLDEQEQEDLISRLAQQNEARNGQFRLLLLCLPAVSTLPYLLALLYPDGSNNNNNNNNGGVGAGAGGRFAALLSLTSLASTAWMLWTLDPGVTGIRVLDAWVGGGSKRTGRRGGGGGGDDDDITSAPFWAEEHSRSPLETYLPYLNLGLCAVLVLAGFVSTSAASQRHWGHVGLSNLPAIVYGVVLVAKVVMGGVDPERDLGALRYEYKGA
ncbi:hypothetical protein M426DRAFT_320967 [Hypoxylon sp. CI-4A]|nr:hypothetical protein M426DRAFT_320967 [Hypoxylon sp. CI-4A]